MEHLCAKTIENGESDVGPILGRIDVHPEGSPSKLSIDDLHDGFRDQAGVGVRGDDSGECFLYLLAESCIWAVLIFCNPRFVGWMTCVRKVISAFRERAGYDNGCLNTPAR